MAPEITFMKTPQDHVRALAAIASVVTVDPQIPVRRYFKSGSEMIRMAKVYLEEKQLENAFILYTKYITLFLEQIPKHPDYASIPDVEKIDTKKKLGTMLHIAEEIKAAIVVEYTKRYNVWKKEKDRIEAEERLQQLQLLEQEDRRMRERQAHEDFEKEKNFRIEQGRNMIRSRESENDFRDDSNGFISPYALDDDLSDTSSISSRSTLYTPLPSIQAIDSRPSSTPSFDRSTKPRSLLSPGPDTEYVHGLRLVVVPLKGIDHFLKLAKENTARNVETCGILAGKMSHNQLIITHVLVPKQTGTADSCSTDNEYDICVYQDKFDLITLGWIHTHPSQTAFMSSVDLHTHFSYQIMMPEAIAIVCSPKYDNTLIFSLTQNFGLDYISQCTEKGFHPHPNESALYEESVHIKVDDHASATVIDLRK